MCIRYRPQRCRLCVRCPERGGWHCGVRGQPKARALMWRSHALQWMGELGERQLAGRAVASCQYLGCKLGSAASMQGRIMCNAPPNARSAHGAT
eukprot:2363426-Pleurochrysis_carterae.AAC.1